MADRTKTLVLLGHISGPHGIRGEVTITSYTCNPADIGAYGPLWDEDKVRTFELASLRVTKKGVIARIAGIDDRNTAQILRGTKLYVERCRLPEPNDGEIYHTDIIGLTAYRQDGSQVGEIVAVQNFGASDLLEIRLNGGRRTELVPWTQDFVTDLDIAAGRVIVIMPDDTVPENQTDEGHNLE